MKIQGMVRFVPAIAIALVSATALAADLPQGDFSGPAYGNATSARGCIVRQVEFSIAPAAAGRYFVHWLEVGSRASDGGYCELNLDSNLTPVHGRDGQWNVDFEFQFDLAFGRATLSNGKLTIEASTTDTLFTKITGSFEFSADQKTVRYDREIEYFSGLPDRVSGTLRAN